MQDHVIQGSANFMEWNSSLYAPTLTTLIAIDIVLRYIWLFDIARPRDNMVMWIYG